jgi:hypothetical protein
MERLYHCYDVDEETPVQFAGVYVTRWRPEWGEPTVLFREVEDDEFATLVRECPEVRELVKACQRLHDICHFLTVRQVIELGDDAIFASGLNPWSLNEGLATGDERIDLDWAQTALSPFEVPNA